jgi:hypothetical protein
VGQPDEFVKEGLLGGDLGGAVIGLPVLNEAILLPREKLDVLLLGELAIGPRLVRVGDRVLRGRLDSLGAGLDLADGAGVEVRKDLKEALSLLGALREGRGDADQTIAKAEVGVRRHEGSTPKGIGLLLSPHY